MGIEYDGRSFKGFQRQDSVSSIQSEIEKALSSVANQPIVVTGAGRTDAGVHATGQVVGFSTEIERSLESWRKGVNSLTSNAINVSWCSEVPADFHARFSATSRRYIYCWYEDPQRSPILEGLAVQANNIDVKTMDVSGQYLLGEHDFTTFRGSGCQSKSPNRCIQQIGVHRMGHFVLLDIKANAFLLHMVRNIAGAIWEVGLGKKSPAWISEVLDKRDRTVIGKTAPPHGLYLVGVDYSIGDFPASRLPGFLRIGEVPDWF